MLVYNRYWEGFHLDILLISGMLSYWDYVVYHYLEKTEW